MTPYKAIIFDLDGTLIHSAPDLQFAANTALAALDRAPLDLATVTSFIGNGVEKLVERSLHATGGTDDGLMAQAMPLFRASYEANLTRSTAPYPGVMACLQQLKSTGVPLGICTNKPDAAAHQICELLGLTGFFDVICGAVAGQPKKPDPRPLLGTIARLGADPAGALYVGDSDVDYRTACNAMVPFRLFTGGYLKNPMLDLPDAARFDDWAVVDFSRP